MVGANIPTATWMTDNVGVFNGTKSLNVTSNLSSANGYLVEYVVADNALTHSAKHASAATKLPGVQGGEIPDTIERTADYRTDTDVIFSTGITALSAINADNPASVTFKITAQNGAVSTKTFTDIVLPAGSSGRGYVNFHIPDSEGTLSVEINTTGDILADTSRITGTVRRVIENTPPNPVATDRNDSFTSPTLPTDFANATQHIWTTYTAEKIDDEWQYTAHENAVTLQAVLSISPDEQVLTANGKTMASGYGFNASIAASLVGNGATNSVAPQTVVATFPEFRYATYNRVLQAMTRSAGQSIFQFKENPYSMVGARVHFTPLWFPDGVYRTYATVRDLWTPVGELKIALSDTLTINRSVYDDWYIAKKS